MARLSGSGAALLNRADIRFAPAMAERAGATVTVSNDHSGPATRRIADWISCS